VNPGAFVRNCCGIGEKLDLLLQRTAWRFQQIIAVYHSHFLGFYSGYPSWVLYSCSLAWCKCVKMCMWILLAWVCIRASIHRLVNSEHVMYIYRMYIHCKHIEYLLSKVLVITIDKHVNLTEVPPWSPLIPKVLCMILSSFLLLFSTCDAATSLAKQVAETGVARVRCCNWGWCCDGVNEQWKKPGCLGYMGDYTTHLCG